MERLELLQYTIMSNLSIHAACITKPPSLIGRPARHREDLPLSARWLALQVNRAAPLTHRVSTALLTLSFTPPLPYSARRRTKPRKSQRESAHLLNPLRDSLAGAVSNAHVQM